MEWIPEIVLQKYVRDNPEHFKNIFDGKIPRIEFNRIRDNYPDLTFVIDNKITIPVEVEWKTSNFLSHKHDSKILTKGIGYDRPGFLLVAKKEENVKIGNIEQHELDLNKFEKWFVEDSINLVTETTKELHIKDERTIPKLWFAYLSLKGDAIKHFEPALKHQVWGIQENYEQVISKNSHIKGIKKGDLIAFIGPGHFPGRISLPKWIKKSFNGYFEKIRVYRITSDYFYNDKIKIWEPKGIWKKVSEVYPHRFYFDRVPLFIMKNCKINKLELTTKEELHSMVYRNFHLSEPSSLVDILHNAEKLDLEESKYELEYISKIINEK